MAARRINLFWLGLLALAALAADQTSKHAVERWTPPGSLRVLVPGLLNLTHTSNSGVAFGLFADEQSQWLAPLLILFSAVVIGFLVWMLVTGRAGGRLAQAGMALILGGALGNVLDRLLIRRVTDFIDFHIGSYHWYTFNIADSAIVAGAGLILLELLADGRQSRRELKQEKI